MHAQTFMPVNGSVPPWPPAAVPPALDADEPDVLVVVDDCESVPLVVEGEPELELDEEPLEPDPVEPVEPELEELG